MTDLKETIERLRERWEPDGAEFDVISRADVFALLDAAERALALDSLGFTPSTPDVERARDAALEEAAKVLDELVFEMVAVSATNDDTVALRIGAQRIRAQRGAA